MKKIGSVLIIIFLWPALVFSGEIAVLLKMDSSKVIVGEPFSLEVEISGSRDSANSPKIHSDGKFELRSRGTTSHMEIVNGTLSVKKVFAYTAFSKKKGTFTLGPALVDIGGKTYKSNKIKVEVLGERSIPKKERTVYCEAAVSNTNPFVGEQIVYTFRFFSRVDTQNASLAMPEFDKFWVEDISSKRRGGATHLERVINGVAWNISEIKKVMFPIKSGIIKLEPATLELSVLERRKGRMTRSLFGALLGESYRSKQVRLTTKPIEIKVRQLPVSKSGASSRLVGFYVVKGSVSKNRVKQGESLTYSVKVTGEGNIRDITTPELSLPTSVKVYDDKPSTSLNVSSNKVVGYKTFKYAIVPQDEGKLTIPPVTVHYFNPKTNKYESSSSTTIIVEVVKGESNSINHTSVKDLMVKKQVRLLGKDLMAIKREIFPLRTPLFGKYHLNIVLFILFFMPFVYFSLLFLKRRGDRLDGDGDLVRKIRAYKEFKARASNINGTEHSFQDISLALRIYIGDKLSIDGSALTVADLSTKVKPFLSNSYPLVEDMLKRCEMGTYGGVGSAVTAEELYTLVAKIEKELS